MNSNRVTQRSNVAGQVGQSASPFAVEIYGADGFAPEMGMVASTREMPAWAISLVVHLLVLVALGSLTRITISNQKTIIDSVMEEVDEEQLQFDTTVQEDQIGTSSDLNMAGLSLSVAPIVGQDPQKDIEQKLQEELLEVNLPVTDIAQPAEAELDSVVETAGKTEHAGGTEGAIDRITYEIANSLRENKTLAIWLFDASLSLNKRRELIADRFENVYKQLGQLDVKSDRALKTAVASFGERTQIITPEPVDNVDEVVSAIRNIAPDTSGKENVFTAVQLVANKWLTYRTKMRRNVMIIIVTDERGDDYVKVESVAAMLARYGIRVFCVGNASIFGREKGYAMWQWPDGSQVELPIDQGPESVKAERLDLPFWGGSRDNRKYERLSAGFGPYALTRLCYETGGVYFVADQSNIRFDPAIMRDYQPDYRPIRDYVKDVDANMAKLALVRACETSSAGRLRPLQLRFQASNDNVLRTQISEAQKPSAVFDHALTEMQTILARGEKDRGKIKEPRWRASYDLAMGRVLAMRVRTYGYNKVLAEMASEPKPFKNKGSNLWRLEPSRDITSGPDVKKLHKLAKQYLTRVIDEHPLTPWAMLAERELGQAMGWQWAEEKVRVAAVNNRRAQDGDTLTLQLAEEARRRAMQKKKKVKKRTLPKL